MTHAAVERQTGDARRRHDTTGHRKPEELRFPIGVAPGRAALRPHPMGFGIDVHAPHLRQVDHEPAVVDGVAGDVVRPRLDREKQIALPGEVDRIDHVRRPGALNDQRRLPVDEAVPDRTRLVVSVVPGTKHGSTNTCRERLNRLWIQRRFGHQLARH